MSFLEHLDELRKRIIRALLVAVGRRGDCRVLPRRHLELRDAAARGNASARCDLHLHLSDRSLHAADPDCAHRRAVHRDTAGFLAGLAVRGAGALTQKSGGTRFPSSLLSSIGFIGGAAFSHYVAFPLMWRFFASFSDEMIVFMPRIEDTFSMYMRMLLGMAAVFQMPAMVFFLARMGVVTARWMIRQFKYADAGHRRRSPPSSLPAPTWRVR